MFGKEIRLFKEETGSVGRKVLQLGLMTVVALCFAANFPNRSPENNEENQDQPADLPDCAEALESQEGYELTKVPQDEVAQAMGRSALCRKPNGAVFSINY
ncbi:MAG TPA: hypothetical protein VD947_01580 [Patescibacteria group bacterium]|nr:hypothetical protein [Patescibacteria group bacterium]